MAVLQWYRNNPLQAYGSGTLGNAPNMDWLSDTINVALVTSSYTPNLNTHDFWDDVVANEVSGGGYTTNGYALASKTATFTAADSFATTWAATTAYGSDTTSHFVRPTVANTYLYRATASGTSAGSQPTWPTTVGVTVVDSGVTWTNVGGGLIQFDAADFSQSSLTVAFRYCVIYNRTPASDATRPLLALYDWGSTQTITSGTVTLTWNPQGLLAIAVA
jgi:hypothetical protein